MVTERPPGTGPYTASEGRIRAQQLMRGSVQGKRVASRRAIESLLSVEISALSEIERSKFKAIPPRRLANNLSQPASSATMTLAWKTPRASTRPLYGCRSASTCLGTTASRNGLRSRIAALTAGTKCLQSPYANQTSWPFTGTPTTPRHTHNEWDAIQRMHNSVPAAGRPMEPVEGRTGMCP